MSVSDPMTRLGTLSGKPKSSSNAGLASDDPHEVVVLIASGKFINVYSSGTSPLFSEIAI